ncbi:MAG TPA: hypothetical protein VF898_12235, partial [Chloroflexota bacterium]
MMAVDDTPVLTGMQVYRRFLPYLRPYWTTICLMVLFLVGQVAMDVLAPWPLKFVFDSVIGKHHIHGALGQLVHSLVGNSKFGLLNLIVVAYILIALADGTFSYFGNLQLSNVGQRFV